jgi:hypothetical protein
VGQAFVFFEARENGGDVNRVVETAMEETWRLQRREPLRLVCRLEVEITEGF